MKFMLARAVNPPLSLLEGLRMWNPMALALREARRRRRYQHDEMGQFLT